jgi:hypothetical protein
MSTDSADSAILETSFQIDSIVPTADPTNGSAQWVRYVISQGPNAENVITGLRQGTIDEAHIALREMVERLNERCGKLAKKKSK